ncbi:disease resistance protein At4g27190 [Ziziphus jujuba]|uniref:Disease resistance protein At4g27190 n=1 Tax=Ziziphus jujuba TaxID=326968 RepID=A0ABM3I1L8_ZIZJJ|nr:disease resistance protein At4g27190 [Ziziphus jujuba]
MEVATSILGSIVAETGRLFCGSIYSKIKRTVKFHKDLDELVKKLKSLIDLGDDVKLRLVSAENQGRTPTCKVKEWLRKVENVVLKVKSMQADIEVNDKKKKLGRLFCYNPRIRHSKKVARCIKEVETLLKAGSFTDSMVSFNHPAAAVEHIPGPSIEDQTTASRTLAELLKILQDDRFLRIGVWGMGGVGKTTLVKSLNNKLKSSFQMQPFSSVIWATVSKEFNMKRVQKQIAERLNLEVNVEESMERTASRLYQRLEKEEKFLLILDDVWEKIDLDCLGVPQPEDHNGSKIILTSRFSEVCREMMTDVEVRMNILTDEESWKLFCRNAGEVASSEQIKPLAEAVARECGGLPLAIITMGSAMRGKTKVELWQHALSELRSSVPCIGSIKNKVYNPLKWSYDSLEGEGLIDEQNNFENSVNKGIAWIEILKDSCLLEDGGWEGTVKMHDIVRDVAIWIASSMEDECKSLVQSGIGLSEISGVQLSDSLKRISFMNNKINKLPDCEIQCSKASTLLLQCNLPLDKVPERFLQGFLSLRVLNLSGTRIQALPHTLFQLSDLRALLLADCFFLEELPPLGSLGRLQVLDLSATRIKELSEEMEHLINLRHLNLSRTHYLKKIQAGMVSRWASLEVLDMTLSTYHWGTAGEVEEGQATFEELGCLKRLFALSIRLKSIPCLRPEDLTWIGRLRKFQYFIGQTANSLPSKHDERRVTISGLNLSEEGIGRLLINASSLVMNGCWGLNQLLEDLAINSANEFAELNSFNTFVSLKSLTITSSNSSFRPRGGCAAPYDLLPHLEEIHLRGLTYLESISELVGHLGLLFSRLKLIEVARCPKIKSLLSYGNFILTLPNLEVIKIRFCEKLEELFNYASEQTFSVDPIVPNLQILELNNLPKLRTLISRPQESCPRLEHIDVIKCNLLRKLPLTIENVNIIKEIRGELQWWNTLDWDNDNTKSSLQHYFKPADPKKTTAGSV